MVKVVDADKINYPYCKAWPTLLDYVPVDEARHLEDNEEEYIKERSK